MHYCIDQVLIQVGIAGQGQHSIGVEHAQEGGSIGPLAAFHVAVIEGGAGKQVLQQLPLAVIEGTGGLEGFTFRWGKTQGEGETIQGRVLVSEVEIHAGHCPERVGDIPLVMGSRFQRCEKWLEFLAKQGGKQAALAAKVMVESGFGDPGSFSDFLHAHGIVATAGEQIQGALEQVFTVVHDDAQYTTRYTGRQEGIE
jgi:hypothetical protein